MDSDPIAGPPSPAMASQAATTAISPTARSTAARRDVACRGRRGPPEQMLPGGAPADRR